MNTIGAIHPDLTDADGPSRMSETLERLNFLVERKSIGLLRGQCHSDVRALTSRLTSQLAHRGFQVAEVHLAGVRSGELPYLFATELGLAVSHHSDEMQSWSLLQGYSESSRRTQSRTVFILTGLELLDESIAPTLDRLLTLFDGVIPCVFASRGPVIGLLKTVVSQYAWLRIDLDVLTPRESIQEFAAELKKHSPELKLTHEAVDSIHSATRGDALKLKRLAELAALAGEADARIEIDSETIRALAAELNPIF